MIQIHAIARRMTGLAVACAMLSFGAMVHAQQAAPAPTVSADEALAIALGNQPLAPERVALGGRFVKAIHMDSGMHDTVAFAFDPIRGQVLGGLPANAPPARKAAFIAALDEALAGLKKDLDVKMMTGLARYYAASVDDKTLGEAVKFYESPLGQKVLAPGEPQTEAEKQAIGEYALAHVEVLDVFSSSTRAGEVPAAIMARERATMLSTFKLRLCQSLKRRGVAMPSCTAAS